MNIFNYHNLKQKLLFVFNIFNVSIVHKHAYFYQPRSTSEPLCDNFHTLTKLSLFLHLLNRLQRNEYCRAFSSFIQFQVILFTALSQSSCIYSLELFAYFLLKEILRQQSKCLQVQSLLLSIFRETFLEPDQDFILTSNVNFKQFGDPQSHQIQMALRKQPYSSRTLHEKLSQY